MRRSPLARRTPLRASADLRRRTPLRKQSAKRAAIAPERRTFVERVLRERRWCEACPVMAARGPRIFRPETVRNAATGAALAVDVHELVRRSQGSPIVPSQGVKDGDVLAVCGSCHRWITDHPAAAVALGLAQWANRPL